MAPDSRGLCGHNWNKKIATVLFLATLKSAYAKSNQKIIWKIFSSLLSGPSSGPTLFSDSDLEELGLIGSRKRRQAGPQGTYICLLSVKQLHLRQNPGAVHRRPKRRQHRKVLPRRPGRGKEARQPILNWFFWSSRTFSLRSHICSGAEMKAKERSGWTKTRPSASGNVASCSDRVGGPLPELVWLLLPTCDQYNLHLISMTCRMAWSIWSLARSGDELLTQTNLGLRDTLAWSL